MARHENKIAISNNADGFFSVKYRISRSVHEIPPEQRTLRSDGRTSKYDMNFTLDTFDGDPNCLARVECDMGETFERNRYYVSNRFKKIPPGTSSSDKTVWRPLTSGDETNKWRCFESRQKTWGIPEIIRFTIVGLGGTRLSINYHPHDKDSMEGHFFEKRSVYSLERSNFLEPLKIPNYPRDFGFYVERVSDSGVSDSDQETSTFSLQHSPWEYQYGNNGLENLRQSVLASSFPSSFHDANLYYHNEFVNILISVDLKIKHENPIDLEKLLKLSQNFIKYEDVFDEILRINRKKKKPEMDSPTTVCAKSNKDAVQGTTNKEKHNMLASCSNTIPNHIEAMNPNACSTANRYKLRYRPVSGSYRSEFFFDAVPNDNDNLILFVQLCIHFVHNSFRLQKPNNFSSNRTIKEKMEYLFSSVIRDRYVERTLLGTNLSLSEEDTSSFGVSRLGCQNSDESISTCSVSIADRKNMDNSSFKNIFSNLPDIIECTQKNATTNLKRKHSEADLNCDQPQVLSSDNLPGELQRTLRSDLTNENKKLTAAKMKDILKKLNAPMSKTKPTRLINLQEYFDARDHELKNILKNEFMPGMGILGIEILLKNDNDSNRINNIQVILKGGRYMKWERRIVCKSKFESDTGLDHIIELTETEAKGVCEELHQKTIVNGAESKIDIYIKMIDAYIDGLPKDEGNACVFALVHDLLS